jgi:hypothetical protein
MNSSVKRTKRSKARRRPRENSDRLISQLENAEDALQHWIKSSPENSNFFRRDPIGAMRTAGLDIDDDILLELELIASSIAKKLKWE